MFYSSGVDEADRTTSVPKIEGTKAKKTAEERYFESVRAVKELEQSISIIPKRPGYGSAGSPQVLLANYFPINYEPHLKLYQYRVRFKPEPKNALATKFTIKRLIEDQFGSNSIATDYAAMLVSCSPLTEDEKEMYGTLSSEHPSNNAHPTYTDWILYYVATHDIDLTLTQGMPKEAMIQALNIAISRKPAADFDNIVNAKGKKGVGGNKFFDMRGTPWGLNDLLSAYRGYHSSVRTSSGRMLLNVNAVAAAFVTPRPVYDLQQDTRKAGGGIVDYARFVKGLRVEYNHPPKRDAPEKNGQVIERRKFRKVIRCLAGWPENSSGLNAQSARFDWDDNGETHSVTVEQYFQKSKHIAVLTIAPTILISLL